MNIIRPAIDLRTHRSSSISSSRSYLLENMPGLTDETLTEIRDGNENESDDFDH